MEIGFFSRKEITTIKINPREPISCFVNPLFHPMITPNKRNKTMTISTIFNYYHSPLNLLYYRNKKKERNS